MTEGNSEQKTRVGVIGLGSMGFGIADSLLRAGYEVSGYDVSEKATQRLADSGGIACPSPRETAEGCAALLTVVVNARQTQDVLFGKDGVAAGLPTGSVIISSATMSPQDAESLAARAEALGFHFLDAPISGGAKKAALGQLSVMASGTSAAFEKAAPVLNAVAQKVHNLGSRAGIGASVKMINQLLAGAHIAAACEAITLAAKLKLDLPTVYEVIVGSAGNSWMFENRVPHVLDGDYSPLSSVEIFVKDLGIIQDMARAERYPVPVAAAALQMFLAASGAGMGKDDDASVAKVYAQLSGAILPPTKST